MLHLPELNNYESGNDPAESVLSSLAKMLRQQNWKLVNESGQLSFPTQQDGRFEY